MADERDQATQVGNKVIDDDAAAQTAVGAPQPGSTQDTAVHQTAPEAATVAGSQRPESLFTRDQAQDAGQAPTPPPPQPRDEAERGGASPAEADRIAADREDAFAEKPHLYALGAFAGAFVLAQILKRLTGDDDD